VSEPAVSEPQTVTPGAVWHPGNVSRSQRWASATSGGATLWFTGLSGSGKSSVAVEVERLLAEAGRSVYLLDGDNLRHGLNGDLGFSDADRTENVRRVGEVARLFADAGVVALVPLISPFRDGRDRARAVHAVAEVPFAEIFIDTPLEICEQRDPKGLYAQARAGSLTGMTGIDAPYEPPVQPDLRLVPADGDVTTMARLVIELLDALN